MSISFYGVLLVILSLSLLACSARLFYGPRLPDRVVAFDLVAAHAVGIFSLLAANTGDSNLLVGAIITLVLGFLGTILLSRFIESPFTPNEEIDQ